MIIQPSTTCKTSSPNVNPITNSASNTTSFAFINEGLLPNVDRPPASGIGERAHPLGQGLHRERRAQHQVYASRARPQRSSLPRILRHVALRLDLLRDFKE